MSNLCGLIRIILSGEFYAEDNNSEQASRDLQGGG